ncbi:RING finger and WD repeat domain-containing protein 3 [Blomia tropicalis]|nr:RING finger and WD repeat domain-containing protein 3 [Blomia tropicalis]
MNNEEQEIQHTIDVTEQQSVPEPIPSTSGTQLTSSEIDNENSCVICTDLWTNSGEHHVVSLKCGHLFEKSCIEKWLPPNKAGICPTCKQKAKLRDIHKIFSRCLRPVDTIERGRAIKRINKLKKENRSLQTELMNQTIAYEDLKREYDEFRLSAYNCAASSTSRSIYNGKRLRSEEDDNHITISRNRNKKEINIEIMM